MKRRQAWDQAVIQKKRQQGTIRRHSGRQFKLDAKNRFLMLLAYYRLYITCTLAGFLFDLDQSNTCRYIQKIESPLQNCVPIPQKMHKLPKRLHTPKEVEKVFPRLSVFHRLTEHHIPRPKNRTRRKTYYSGKKKRHTVNTVTYG